MPKYRYCCMNICFKDFLQLVENTNGNYSYSSLQYNLPVDLSKKIVKWGKDNIPSKDVFVDKNDDSFGMENQIHFTILYGIHDKKPTQVIKILEKVKPFTVKLGKVSTFSNDDFEVVKIEVSGNKLFELNKLLRNNLDYTSKYKDYKPHITIGYVKKGKGLNLKNEFYGKELTVEDLIFSNPSKEKTKIKLS